jgi:hypothetical protein
MNRRDLLKNLSTVPFAGIVSNPENFLTVGIDLNSNTSMNPDNSIYSTIGVEPIINCRGTFTIIGGSMELPEAHKMTRIRNSLLK